MKRVGEPGSVVMHLAGVVGNPSEVAVAIGPHDDPDVRIRGEVAGTPVFVTLALVRAAALVIATATMVVVAIAEAHPVRGGVRTHDKCEDAKNGESFHGVLLSGGGSGFNNKYATNQ